MPAPQVAHVKCEEELPFQGPRFILEHLHNVSSIFNPTFQSQDRCGQHFSLSCLIFQYTYVHRWGQYVVDKKNYYHSQILFLLTIQIKLKMYGKLTVKGFIVMNKFQRERDRERCGTTTKSMLQTMQATHACCKL